MAKIPPKLVEQELISPREDEWWEFCHNLEQRDWSNWDQHPWEWYMEVSIRRDEGWHHIRIDPKYDTEQIARWLKDQDAKFKYSHDDFLIQDPVLATMVAIKWGRGE